MVAFCRRIVEHPFFQNGVLAVIVANAVLIGMATNLELLERHQSLFRLANLLIQVVFVVEIAIRLTAFAPRVHRFFADGWNVFDFVIVAGAFLPFAAQYATVLRLLRLLRVLKLVRALPKLQLLVGALLKSIPSMGYVSILLVMLFYVYAVAAVFMWGGNDPHHFGDLQTSFLSLFRAVTLEDWTDLMYINMYGCDQYGYDGLATECTKPEASPVGAALFFVSFILIGTMVFLNLFIGVILSGMDEARDEADEEKEKERISMVGAPTSEDELIALTNQLVALQEHVERIKLTLKEEKAQGQS